MHVRRSVSKYNMLCTYLHGPAARREKKGKKEKGRRRRKKKGRSFTARDEMSCCFFTAWGGRWAVVAVAVADSSQYESATRVKAGAH